MARGKTPILGPGGVWAILSLLLGSVALAFGRLPEVVFSASHIDLMHRYVLDLPIGALAVLLGLKATNLSGGPTSTRDKAFAAVGIILGALACLFAIMAAAELQR